MKTRHYLTVIIIILIIVSCKRKTGDKESLVNLQVDLAQTTGSMDQVWSWFGYDEPNYTYMENGKKLLSEIADFSPVPVYVRAHNLLNTGDGTPALKWGSTNAYTEDENGDPVYDWTIIDSIFDTYIERGMKPLVEIGFMPKALSVNSEPYKHNWKPGAEYGEIYTGWAYPPSDYEKWAGLVNNWVKHSIDRYGKEEVESWYWEAWNEPNIGYWQGTTEEFLKLYDYTAHAVKSALPTAMFGGPHSTGPSWDEAADFLITFLDHVSTGTNYVTGETGSPLDFIAFHAKGSSELVDGIIQMNLGTQLRDISRGFEIVSSYPEFRKLPVIIGESDPEGCAACSVEDYPENAYRNGTMYSSYTAAAFARKYRLADTFDINLKGAVTWAFQFEDQPWFNGYRSLATNGIAKPVLNVFRMFGMMQGDRVKVSGDIAYDYITVRDSSVRGEAPDINALAAVDSSGATIMVWNYHDVDITGAVHRVNMDIKGVPAGKVKMLHYRVDTENSNSYNAWIAMGFPQKPSASQYAELEKASELQLYRQPKDIDVQDGKAEISFLLPRQAVSLVKLEWKTE